MATLGIKGLKHWSLSLALYY